MHFFYFQVIITPHIAGRPQSKHVAEHFIENYDRFEKNLPVTPQLDFSKGY